MPDMLTKYPDSAFAVLKSAGAQCGATAKAQILTSCPPEQLCRFPHGEICVFGLNDVGKMSQISVADLSNLVSQVPTIYSDFNIILLLISCLFGIGIGMWLRKK